LKAFLLPDLALSVPNILSKKKEYINVTIIFMDDDFFSAGYFVTACFQVNLPLLPTKQTSRKPATP